MIRAVPIGQNAAIHLLQIILSDLHFHNTFQFVKINMVLQPNFFHCLGTEQSQRALTCKNFIICSC